MSKYSCCADVPYEYLVRFMQKMSEVPAKKKDQHIELFLNTCLPRCKPDIFQTFRLLLPLDDMERRSYRMKQEALAPVLVNAAGLSKENPEAKRAINWRQAGVRNAGNFPEVVEQYVLRKACLSPEDPSRFAVTIGGINTALDRLAAAEDKKEQTRVLRELMGRCTSRQMKWLVRIILKDLKIGLSQAKLMSAFHPDALYLLQMTSDLQYVTTKLADPNTREPRMDIEPGRCVMAQRCVRVNTIEEMHKGMRGQPFTVEVKFDGNRLQLHRTPQGTFYFSRRGREHGELTAYTVFDRVLDTQVSAPRIVLDGELIVWNKTRGVFEPFGGLRSTINAANEGKGEDHVVLMTDNWGGPTGGSLGSSDPDYLHPTAGDLELVYVAFDILFEEHESLITLPLRLRQQRLAQAVRCLPAAADGGVLLGPEGGCIRGRIVTLLPGVPLALPVAGSATSVPAGSSLSGAASSSCPAVPELLFSRIGSSLQDLQNMMDMANARQEEGIVAKQLESPWKADDKSGTWLKLKPDYFHMQEVDAVIIGGHYGSGRNGGLVSEFLLGLTEGGGVAGATQWCSFCKVGTGMSDLDRQKMREKLEPVLVEAGPGDKPPPCYRVTGREKPDFWVSDPTRSIVVEVTSDIRTIASNVYAADHSLRFPRIKRVRWDRAPSDITSYPELEAMVVENKGRLNSYKMGMDAGDLAGLRLWGARRRAAGGAAGGRGPGRPRVVEALALPDNKGVVSRSVLLSGAACYFRNYCDPSAPESVKAAAKKELGGIVAAHGGTVVAAPTSETEFVFAAVLHPDVVEAQRRTEVKRPASVHDVLSTDWLREVDAAGAAVDIMPRHYLFMSAATRTDEARRDEVDEYGNPWYSQLQVDDVQSLVDRLIPDRAYTAYQHTLAQGQKLQEQQEDEALAAEAAAAAAADGGDAASQAPLRGRRLPAAVLGSTAAATAAAAAAGEGGSSLPDGSSGGSLEGRVFRTEEGVVLGLQRQLQALVGWRDRSAVLFSGCCLLFVPYTPGAPPPAAATAAQAQQQQQGLDAGGLVLASSEAAQQLAQSWQQLQDLQALSEAKLAVVQHGGTVAAAYSSAVTHIVLWPLGWGRQQLAGGKLLGGGESAAAEQQQLPQVLSMDMGGEDDQQQQQLNVPVQQLLRLLAAAASAAADAGVTAAASKAAAGAAVPTGAAAAAATQKAVNSNTTGGGGRSLLRPSRGRFKIASAPAAPPAPAPAAAAAAAEPNSTVAAVGTASLLPALPGTTAAAGGPGDATPPSLSPAALKLLRKIRRRLEAAQEAAAPPPTAAAAAADVFNSSGSFRRQHSSSRRRGQGAGGGGPLRPLLLVGPGWVADSVTDLQQQLQRHSSWQLTQQLLLSQQQQGVGSFTQQQSQQGVFQSFDSQASLDLLRTELRQQRRSEVLYMVKAVLPPQQQQQQQQQGEGQQLLTAAAAGDGAVGGEEGGVMGSGVMGWPWGSVGLKARDGAASSGESSDGGSSEAPSTMKKSTTRSTQPGTKRAAAAGGSSRRGGKKAVGKRAAGTPSDTSDSDTTAAGTAGRAAAAAAAARAAKRPAAKKRRRVTKIRSPSPEDPTDPATAAAAAAAAAAGDDDDGSSEGAPDGVGPSTAAAAAAAAASRTRAAGRSRGAATARSKRGRQAATEDDSDAEAAAAAAAVRSSTKRARGGRGAARSSGRTRIRGPAAAAGGGGDTAAGGNGEDTDTEPPAPDSSADVSRGEGVQGTGADAAGIGAAAAAVGERVQQDAWGSQAKQQQQQQQRRRLRHLSSVKGTTAARDDADMNDEFDEDEGVGVERDGLVSTQHKRSGAAAAAGAGGGGRGRRSRVHGGVQSLFDDLAEQVEAEGQPAAAAAAAGKDPTQQQLKLGASKTGKPPPPAAAEPQHTQQQQQQRSSQSGDGPSSNSMASQGLGGRKGGSVFDALFSGAAAPAEYTAASARPTQRPAAAAAPAAAAVKKPESTATTAGGSAVSQKQQQQVESAAAGSGGEEGVAAAGIPPAVPSQAAKAAEGAAAAAGRSGVPVSLSSFLFGGSKPAAAAAAAGGVTAAAKAAAPSTHTAAEAERGALVQPAGGSAAVEGERSGGGEKEERQGGKRGGGGAAAPAEGLVPMGLSAAAGLQHDSGRGAAAAPVAEMQSAAAAAPTSQEPQRGTASGLQGPSSSQPPVRNSLAAKLAKFRVNSPQRDAGKQG